MILRPKKELEGFEKVLLSPGKSKTVHIKLDEGAFQYYNDVESAWVKESATFEIHVGSSSRLIRFSSKIKL